MQLKKLKTKFLGKNSIYYKEIDSTQSEIWRLIQTKTAPNGTLVFADIQTKGKGTHGRIWHLKFCFLVFIPIPTTRYFTFSEITLVSVKIPPIFFI